MSRLRLVDTDVHPVVDIDKDILPRLPLAWRERFRLKGFGNPVGLPFRFAHPHNRILRVDATPPAGGAPGSDPAFMREQLLDAFGVDCAILCCLQGLLFGQGQASPDDSAIVMSAINDFFIDTWLPLDARYKYAMLVTPQDPLSAAAEIRRVGHAPGVVAVHLPGIDVLLGSRYFDPIYEAAVEAGLPIYVHAGGAEMVFQGGARSPVGFPESYIERYVDFPCLAAAQLASVVLSGTFERFPSLRVAFVEYGFTWALPLLWRMDVAWNGLRIEVPWVKRAPSEYVHEHIRFATQPFEEPPPKHLAAVIDMLGDDLLMFSSDYPHWDNDMPDSALKFLSDEARSRVVAGNAASFFPLER